jgi:prepilin-type N-terminal cleavage/methylation domain-containing protein
MIALKKSGFTLLEIMLAISILAILVVILVSGLQVGIKSWEKGEERIEETQTIRIIQDLIFQDIQSCYPYKQEISKKAILAFKGQAHRIDFISASQSYITHEKEIGLREVSLYIDDDSGSEEEGLVIREAAITGMEDIFEDSRGTLVELDPRVKSISFQYFIASDSLQSKQSDLENGKWLSQWDSMSTSMDIPIDVESDDTNEQIQLYTQKYFPRAIQVDIEVEVKHGKSVDVVKLPSLVVPVKTGQHFSSTSKTFNAK